MVLLGRHPESSQSDTNAYLRQARRLRSRFRGQPARLHIALRQLAEQRDGQATRYSATTVRRVAHEQQAVQPEPAPAMPASAATEAILVTETRALLDGTILRYSCRQQLLRRASELGISRFHANLLIATAMHQARPRPARERRVTGSSWMPAIAFFFLLQSALFFTYWLLLR